MLNLVLLLIVLIIVILLVVNYKKLGGARNSSTKFYNNQSIPKYYQISEQNSGVYDTIGLVFSDRVFVSTVNQNIFIISQPTSIAEGDHFLFTGSNRGISFFNIIFTKNHETVDCIMLDADYIPTVLRKINPCVYQLYFNNPNRIENFLYIENCTQVGYLALFEDDDYYYYVHNGNYRDPFVRINKHTFVILDGSMHKLELFVCHNYAISKIELTNYKDNISAIITSAQNLETFEVILLSYNELMNRRHKLLGHTLYGYSILFNRFAAIKIILLNDNCTLQGRIVTNPRYVNIQSDNIMYYDKASPDHIYYCIYINNIEKVIQYKKNENIVETLNCFPGTEDCNEYDTYAEWRDPALTPIQFVDTELETI